MSDLTDLPEIGKTTASELESVGIPDAATLREVGAREAFLRIRANTLSPEDRAELRDWYRSLD